MKGIMENADITLIANKGPLQAAFVITDMKTIQMMIHTTTVSELIYAIALIRLIIMTVVKLRIRNVSLLTKLANAHAVMVTIRTLWTEETQRMLSILPPNTL